MGPVVVTRTETGCGVAVAPAAICAGVKVQVTVASGSPLQAKVIGTNVVAPGVTVKVVVVDCPESGAAGLNAVGVDKAKVGATMT